MASLLMKRCLVLRTALKFKEVANLRCLYTGTNTSLQIARNLQPLLQNEGSLFKSEATRHYSAQKEDEKKPTLFQKFKKMYKEYWYVLVPVHLVTSFAWFGGFYYLAKSGVDLVAILESLHFSEKITNPLKDSSVGYLAIAYGMYKIVTPIRYGVTLGGTTVLINYLKEWGYIKPVPSREQLKQMYQDKIGSIKVKTDTLKYPTTKNVNVGPIGKKTEEKETTVANIKDKKEC